MNNAITIRGLTWDHPRAYDGLFAETDRFNASQDDIVLEWAIQSLSSFEATPIEQLAAAHDLIILDHPFMGDAASTGALLNLNKKLPADFLRDARLQYVGASFESYEYDGGLWALPIDAACQTAAYRPDLIDGRAPKTFDEVLQFGQQFGLGLAMANPHAFMNFLAIAGRSGADLRGEGDRFLEEEIALDALSILRSMARYLPEAAFDWSSIGLLEEMATSNQLSYCPMVFCFNTYCQSPPTGRHRLAYCDLPAQDPAVGNRGSVIGGAGLAVSALSKSASAALNTARRFVSRDVQLRMTSDGGQPAHLAAWTKQSGIRINGTFFDECLAMQSEAVLRPRYAGYIEMQKLAGKILREDAIEQDRPLAHVIDDLEGLFAETRCI